MDHAHFLAVGDEKGRRISELLTWEPPMDRFLRARLAVGNATDEDFASIPQDQALEISDLVKGRVPEVMGMWGGPFILAPVIRDYLEVHEPGIHQFAPIRICTAKRVDGTTEHGTHWLLRAPPRVDCLIFEETYFTYDFQGKAWSHERDESDPWGGGILLRSDAPCTLDGGQLAGRNLWRVATGGMGSDYCCSPQFWEFYKSNKMLGWESVKLCKVR